MQREGYGIRSLYAAGRDRLLRGEKLCEDGQDREVVQREEEEENKELPHCRGPLVCGRPAGRGQALSGVRWPGRPEAPHAGRDRNMVDYRPLPPQHRELGPC